jgi:diaminopimelate epimerase
VGISFAKYEGLGNDFIVVDEDVPRGVAMAMCDRHLGVGADGVLITGVSSGMPFMRVINADGSTPEMCGNGLRCVALHLSTTGLVNGEAFDVETDAGPHRCRILADGRVEVAMAVPSLAPSDLPVTSDREVIDAPWDVDGETRRVTGVSMGNPHIVLFDVDSDARVNLGPILESDDRFPERVNVGFATMHGESAMDLEVFERGVGWTRACGTGACAAVVAAVETGRAARHRPVTVTLPGGPLVIEVRERGEHVFMTGPARHVFSGTVARS